MDYPNKRRAACRAILFDLRPLNGVHQVFNRHIALIDNIRDCWTRYGDGDMLDRAAIIAERHGLFRNRVVEEAFALTTSEADKALGHPRRELRAGAVADLVAIETTSIADAVVDRPPRSLVLRAGRIAAEQGDASAALKKVAIASIPAA